jgi:hypothetical protein
MPTYTITLDDDETKVFNHFHDPQNWAETLFVNRANVAMQELFRVELTKAKLNGKLVPADMEQAVLNSDEQSIAERNAEAAIAGPNPNNEHSRLVAQGLGSPVDPMPANAVVDPNNPGNVAVPPTGTVKI